MIEKRLSDLNQQYTNAFAIFSGAYWAHQAIISGNMADFVSFLPAVITNVKFYGWHETIPQALRRFCHLCLVDPALVEAYLGMKFEEVQP